MFREGNSIIVNPERNKITDLDALPYPDYSVFDSRELMESHFTVTSRGCPYKCTYCTVPMINGSRWRFRSVENIIDEIRSIAKEYDRFAIIDDTFTQRLSRAKRFCEEYIKSGIGLTWSCPCGIRADRLDEELVSLMKRAGCTRVALGIETLDENVFDSLNKGEKVGAVIDAIRLLKKYEIQVSALLIIGLPGSTYERDKYTVETVRNLGIGSLINIFAPYPGTEATNRVSNGTGFELVEDIKTTVPLPRDQPQVFISSKEYDYREVEKMYYYANLRLGNYNTLLNPYATSIGKAVRLAGLVLKYDHFHLFGHLGYMTRRRLESLRAPRGQSG